MPKFRVPCFVQKTNNFYLEVEADSTTNAIVAAKKLIESADVDVQNYIDDCISKGSEEFDEDIFVVDDDGIVEDISDEITQSSFDGFLTGNFENE